jgi:hypothetical protein
VRSIRSTSLAAGVPDGMNQWLKMLSHGPVGSSGFESEVLAGGAKYESAGAGS